MKKIILFLSLLLAACTAQPYWQDDRSIATPAVHLSPTAAPVSTIGWAEYTVIGTVNIRSQPDVNSIPAGLLFKGAKIQADCNRSDRFCSVIGGYVIKACLGIGEEPCK